MNIAIIGAGRIGSGYGKLWLNAGHGVTYGIRTPDAKPGMSVSSIPDAVRHADVVLLAIPGAVVNAVTADLELAGKVLIDATNGASPGESPQRLQRNKPAARVVRAFNYYGFDLIGHSGFQGIRADAFLCGDDTDARRIVAGLATDAGFSPVDLGDLSNAGIQDNLLGVWFALSKRLRTRILGFKVLHDEPV
jgi:8-hydroxy-5-deazaflavin:NADPH oxidoreductase